MSKTYIKTCPECSVTLEKRNLKGQVMPWKDFPRVLINENFFTLECSLCNEKYMTGDEISALSTILENVIKKETSICLDMLKKITKLKQKKLAVEVGVSEVYFSNLIGMKTAPSFEKFKYLKLLSENWSVISDNNVVGSKSLSDVNNIMSMDKFKHLKHEEKVKIHSMNMPFQSLLNEDKRYNA